MVSKPKRLYRDQLEKDKTVSSKVVPKRQAKRKPKYQRPVHEIDPKDPLIDDEEFWHD